MRLVLLLALVSTTSFVHADAPVGNLKLSVAADASSVTYHLVHKLHKFDGVSKHVEGRALVQPGGPTQVAIRVPVESFDSGNTNRDAHMKEVTEVVQYPNVEIKAAGDGIVVPTTFPTTIQKMWKAQVSFHGVVQAMELPVTVKFEAADRVVATTSFQLSLDAFKVERPSLMFVKVDDALKVDATLTFGP